MSDIIASPSVRRSAAQKGIDIEQRARALGRETMTHDDLRETAPPNSPSALNYWDVDHAKYGEVSVEPLSRIAKISAQNLAAAQSLIPAVTHHDRAGVAAVEHLRKSLKAEATARGVKLTALAFHVAVLTRCLQEFPRFNASLSADGKDLVLKSYVHIGIAVDTDYGLVVPVIRNTDTKGIWQIAQEITELATRATLRKLRPEDMGGASMTISNLGGIGGIGFTPIVNPPEVAILGITRTETVTMWTNDTPRPVQMVPLDLSYDHRVINGAEAARFLVSYSKKFAELRNLLV